MNLIGGPPLNSIPSSKEPRIVRILRKYVEPDLLAAIPPDILNSPTFPYNEDRTARWCYPCKAFKSVNEFYTQGRKIATRCKQHKVPSEIRRGRNLKQNYRGFMSEEYDALFSQQGGVCAICKQPERRTLRGKPLPLSIDHCHTSHKIRVLLCSECNTSFGLLREDPERIRALLAYAEQWQDI